MGVQQAASSKVNHLGTVPAAFGGAPGSTDEQRKAAEAGGIAGFAAGKLSFPSKKVTAMDCILPCHAALGFLVYSTVLSC